MQNVFAGILNPPFGFAEMLAAIGGFLSTLAADPTVNTLWESITLDPGEPSSYVHVMILGLCLTVAFFGKRMLPFLRFFLFLAIGYAVGLILVFPLLTETVPNLPGWAVGLILGSIAAIASKYLYPAVCIWAVWYFVYVALLSGSVGVVEGNTVASIALSLCAVALVLVFRNCIEILVTSATGAWGVATVITVWWNYTALSFLSGIEWVGVLSVSALIAVLGFAYQYRTGKQI